jgi:hypothetical protein
MNLEFLASGEYVVASSFAEAPLRALVSKQNQSKAAAL